MEKVVDKVEGVGGQEVGGGCGGRGGGGGGHVTRHTANAD